MARCKKMYIVGIAFLLLVVINVSILIINFGKRTEVLDPSPTNRTFTKGAVAADNEKCSEIGVEILNQGGSAVDAAIAALLCTGIMNPQSAGIGGGSIFTILNSTGIVKIINSRETAPSSVDSDLLKSCPKDSSKATGINWIGVPGEIRGYKLAHDIYGRLNWSDLFNKTIELARNGFPIPPILASYIATTKMPKTMRKLYSYENGTLLSNGAMIKFEKLADTLELIANKGPDAFYTGRVAEDLVCVSGGNLELEDLKSYEATETDAWDVPVGKKYHMYIPPPPSGGPLLSFVLNSMKGYENTQAPQSVEEKTTFYDRYVKALKWANRLRKCIRDPRFVTESFQKMAKAMTNISFADNPYDICAPNCSSFNDWNDMVSEQDDYESVGTTHVSVLDENGTFVAVTSSINGIFGSKVYSPSTGILLNNQLADFCGVANKIGMKGITKGERPPSSMAPAVLKPISSKSKLNMLVIGASGGKMITTGIASALINHLWFGKSLKEAIDTPVVYVDCENKMNFEPSFDIVVTKNLEILGHELGNKFYNVVNAVEIKDGNITAVSDDRKLGKAASN